MGYWDKYFSGSSDTSSAHGSTPAADTSSQNYDSTQQADPNNPWGDTPATPSEEAPNPKPDEGQNALVTASQESEKAAEPEQPRNANAQQALADTQTQVDFNIPDNFDPSTLPDNFWSMSDAEQTQYLANTFGVNTPTQTPTQTAPQQSQQTAQNDEGAAALQAASNTVDPNGIYDPSKTYGRQENGSYVYSNSAAQLQRDLNRLTNAGLTVDGYFGEKTQQALNNYLSQFNQPQAQTPASGTDNATETAGADALTQSASEAETSSAPENSQQSAPETTNRFNPWQTLRDGWNALFNYNGTPTATQPQPESTPAPIRDSATDADMARAEQRDQRRLQAEEAAELEREAERQNILNGNQNVAPSAPVMQVSGASNNNPTLGEALSAQTFSNGFNLPQQLVQPPQDVSTFGQGAIAPQQAQETQQSPFPTPTSNGYVSTADFNANDYRNQLEQMENEPTRPMTGNSMSAALENYQPNEAAAQSYQDNYDFLYSTGGQTKDGVTLGMGKNYWKEATPTPDDAFYENLYRHGETPASMYRGRSSNVSEEAAYGRAQEYQDWLRDRGLTEGSGGMSVADYQRDSSNAPGARSGAYWDANRPEVHYGDTRNTSLKDSETLSLYDEMENLYRNSVADPHSNDETDYQALFEEMENEEPESTIPDVLPTPKAGASMAGNSYSRALADNQARPDTNIFRQDAPDVDEFRRAYEESMNRQNSSPDVRYGQQFMEDMRQLRQQFPTYSDTALFDMALFNEEMRNGQSSYYKWIANQLG